MAEDDLGMPGMEAEDGDILPLDELDETARPAFQPLPPGIMMCEIADHQYAISKAGNPMISVQFRVTDPRYDGRLLFTHFVLNSEFGRVNLKKFLVRVCPEVDLKTFAPKRFCNEGTAIGRPCRVRIRIGVNKGKKGNEVREILAAGDASADFLDGLNP